MPIYEFKCTNCGQTFDDLCSIGDTEAICPNCKSVAVKSTSIHKTVSTGLPNGFCGNNNLMKNLIKIWHKKSANWHFLFILND
jgi:putative FmdB family regulatory protein